MLPHRLILIVIVVLFSQNIISAQARRPPVGGRLAVIVDERLSALRATPQLNGRLVRRLGRGRMVAIRAMRVSSDGITFLRVNVSSRTHGWIQREAVVSPSRAGDDRRLVGLIERSHGFDRIARARIFLDYFPRSPLRPAVLLLFGDAVEGLAGELSTNAARRLGENPDGAPEFSYYMNYSGLDRYNRLRVEFLFDETDKSFHYDGAAWRELIRRYPESPEAGQARKRLGQF